MSFKVKSNHQIERGGRMFSPNQVITGFDPAKNPDDAALLDHGQVIEVPAKPAAKKPAKSTAKKPTENKADQVDDLADGNDDSKEQA